MIQGSKRENDSGSGVGSQHEAANEIDVVEEQVARVVLRLHVLARMEVLESNLREVLVVQLDADASSELARHLWMYGNGPFARVRDAERTQYVGLLAHHATEVDHRRGSIADDEVRYCECGTWWVWWVGADDL